MDYAKRSSTDAVVISACWSRYFDRSADLDQPVGDASSLDGERVFSELGRTLRELNRMGKKTYIVLNNPIGEDVDPHSLVRRHIVNPAFTVRPAAISRGALLQYFGAVNSQLRTLAIDSGAAVVDPMTYLCDATSCPVVTPES